MGKYIHNISGSSKTYQGIEIPNGDFFLIPPMLYNEFSDNADLILDIQNNLVAMSRDGITDLATVENSLALLETLNYRVSVAVDKEGIDQLVSGTSPVVINADRVLWDLHEDYDLDTEDFIVPIDGVYTFDCQIKLTNLSNVASVELAIYKRGTPDDYWFILDKKDTNSLTEVQLSGATSFDFYKDERYCLKLILTKVLPLVGCSCTIDGSDDYTAWGYNLSYPL